MLRKPGDDGEQAKCCQQSTADCLSPVDHTLYAACWASRGAVGVSSDLERYLVTLRERYGAVAQRYGTITENIDFAHHQLNFKFCSLLKRGRGLSGHAELEVSQTPNINSHKQTD